MPFCMSCGNEVADNAAFCFSCGAEMKPTAAPPPPSAAGEPSVEDSGWGEEAEGGEEVALPEAPAWGAEDPGPAAEAPAWGTAAPPTEAPSWGASPAPAWSGGAQGGESPAWPPSLSRQMPASPSPPPPPPAAPAGISGVPAVPNYLVGSILATLCCCLPGGLVSLAYAVNANTKAGQGLFEEAMQAANTARIWLMVSVGLGLLLNVGCGLFFLLVAMANA